MMPADPCYVNKLITITSSIQQKIKKSKSAPEWFFFYNRIEIIYFYAVGLAFILSFSAGIPLYCVYVSFKYYIETIRIEFVNPCHNI